MTLSEIKTPTTTEHVLAMLAKPKGADLKAICNVTGWQRHSARAALSRLRKAGHVIERLPGGGKGGASVYRIAVSAQAMT